MSLGSGTGTVYLVGAGPGAADLLTLRAARLLAEAEVVFYDALVPREILDLVKTTRLVPVGKRCGRHSTAQRFINQRIYEAARKHRIVVRLKGGDPMLFGRAHEEIAFLRQQDIPVEVVPGVTAALAASADLGIPLTRRGIARSVAFVTPRVGESERGSRWVDAVRGADTAAIYMGAGEAPMVARALLAADFPASTPVAIVENASLPYRRAYFGRLAELTTVVPASPAGPVLIFIGEAYAEAVTQCESASLLPPPERSVVAR